MVWISTAFLSAAIGAAIWIGYDWSHRGELIAQMEAEIGAQKEALHSERLAIAEWEAAYNDISEKAEATAKRLASREADYRRLERDTAKRLAAVSAAQAESDRCLDRPIGGTIYGILRQEGDHRGGAIEPPPDRLPEDTAPPAATDADTATSR